MREDVSGLVLARPGPQRDGLQALLLALPQIAHVDLVDNLTAAALQIEKRRPAIVLLEFGLPNGETQGLLRQVERLSPLTRCIVLANSVPEQLAAKAAGAEVVLLTGVTAPGLLATIERSLGRETASGVPPQPGGWQNAPAGPCGGEASGRARTRPAPDTGQRRR